MCGNPSKKFVATVSLSADNNQEAVYSMSLQPRIFIVNNYLNFLLNNLPGLQKQPETHGEQVSGTRLLQPIGHDDAHARYSFNGSLQCCAHSLGRIQREFGSFASASKYGSRQRQPGEHSPGVEQYASGFEQLRAHLQYLYRF